MSLFNLPLGGILDIVGKATKKPNLLSGLGLPFPLNILTGGGGSILDFAMQPGAKDLLMPTSEGSVGLKSSIGNPSESQAVLPSPSGQAMAPGQLDTPFERYQKQLASARQNTDAAKQKRRSIKAEDYEYKPKKGQLPWAMAGAALIQALTGGNNGANALQGFMKGFENKNTYEANKADRRYQKDVTAADQELLDAQTSEKRLWEDFDLENKYGTRPKESAPAAAKEPVNLKPLIPRRPDENRMPQQFAAGSNLNPKFQGRVANHYGDFDGERAGQMRDEWDAIQRLAGSKEKQWADIGLDSAHQSWNDLHDYWSSGRDSYSQQAQRYEQEAQTLKGQIDRFEREYERAMNSGSEDGKRYIADLYPDYERASERYSAITGTGGLMDKLNADRRQFKDAIAFTRPPQSLKPKQKKRPALRKTGRLGG